VEKQGARQSLCAHEAGHSVAAAIVLQRLVNTMVCTKYETNGLDIHVVHYGNSGGASDPDFVFQPNKCDLEDLPPALQARVICSAKDFLPSAIMVCAGPAAEARFCEEENLPFGSTYFSASDREEIDRLCWLAHNSDGTDKEVFERTAWARTHEFINHPSVWMVIKNVANELFAGLRKCEPEVPTTGQSVAYVMSAPRLNEIIDIDNISASWLRRRAGSPLCQVQQIRRA
jgi:hypothetical protein